MPRVCIVLRGWLNRIASNPSACINRSPCRSTCFSLSLILGLELRRMIAELPAFEPLAPALQLLIRRNRFAQDLGPLQLLITQRTLIRRTRIPGLPDVFPQRHEFSEFLQAKLRLDPSHRDSSVLRAHRHTGGTAAKSNWYSPSTDVPVRTTKCATPCGS